ncbi:MAG: right-handed parallel beta-helix repeat-containing protein [Candidatus Cloacimonetes bacterium]|nr:right-handed parallel beta-helix repeat-containing protein [Candidatus Cloacimonadota bacterium]
MKKLFTFIILIIVSASVFAQTEVSGTQSGTWTLDNSPYHVVGQITVSSGNILTIEAGVEVNFQGHYKLKIQGNLQAIGTESENILFTTDNQAIGWGGIRLDGANGISNLAYCRIEYGKTSGSYPDIHGGGLALLTSNAVISNCVFADNDATGSDNGMGGAVYAINTSNSTSFIDCKFIGNHAYGEGGAIKFSSDNNSEIVGCEFIGNNCLYGGGAISFYSVYNTKMINCLFAENYTVYSSGGALHTLGMGNSIILQNCTISGNSAQHGDGGAISLAYASADIVNSIVYDNPGMYSDGIYIDFSSTAEINYSNLTMPDEATGYNNINQNPLFVDANNLDFHLTEASPCIDAGTDIGLEYFGESPDMGCFEWFIIDVRR